MSPPWTLTYPALLPRGKETEEVGGALSSLSELRSEEIQVERSVELSSSELGRELTVCDGRCRPSRTAE